MTSKCIRTLSLHWGLFALVVSLLIFGIFTLILGHVPVANTIITGDIEVQELPFTVPRVADMFIFSALLGALVGFGLRAERKEDYLDVPLSSFYSSGAVMGFLGSTCIISWWGVNGATVGSLVCGIGIAWTGIWATRERRDWAYNIWQGFAWICLPASVTILAISTALQGFVAACIYAFICLAVSGGVQAVAGIGMAIFNSFTTMNKWGMRASKRLGHYLTSCDDVDCEHSQSADVAV